MPNSKSDENAPFPLFSEPLNTCRPRGCSLVGTRCRETGQASLPPPKPKPKGTSVLAAHLPRTVLCPNDVSFDLGSAQRAQTIQDAHLVIAHDLRVERFYAGRPEGPIKTMFLGVTSIGLSAGFRPCRQQLLARLRTSF